MNWQHVNVLAATNYLRERIASGVPDARARDVYEGLLDVLDPSRIEKRIAALTAATAAAAAEQIRLKPDTTGQARKASKKKASGAEAPQRGAKAAIRRATAARRPPARPAKPRRR